MVFQPLQLWSKVGNLEQFMIDGGVIANNPSIYAYQVARYFNDAIPGQDPKNLNIMSFAAGNSKFTPIKSPE